MALYRNNTSGFLQEFASNPGSGYTAISAQPTDTLANRVNWWRAVDKGSLTSTWHPSLIGGTEVPAPPGVNGSGVNVMAWRYTSFEELGDLGYDGLPPFTYEGAGTITPTRPAGLAGYHGNYRLRLTWGSTNGTKLWLGQLATLNNIDLYNIKLTTNRRWIVSLYVAPTSSGAKAFNVLLMTKSVAGATATYTTALATGATTGEWTRVSFGLDLSADAGSKAVLGFSANAGIVFDLDGIMIEEWAGSLATPSAYSATTGFVTGEQLIDVAVDKLTAGTITGKTITLDGATSILKSSNYAAGSAGWQIRGDGAAEFSSAAIRGTLTADKIVGGTLNCAGLTVSNFSATNITAGTITTTQLSIGGVATPNLASNAVTYALSTNAPTTPTLLSITGWNTIWTGTMPASTSATRGRINLTALINVYVPPLANPMTVQARLTWNSAVVSSWGVTAFVSASNVYLALPIGYTDVSLTLNAIPFTLEVYAPVANCYWRGNGLILETKR